MQELKHQKTILESLSQDDISRLKEIESKFKGSLVQVGLISKETGSHFGYYPINAVLPDNLEISRTNGQISIMPTVTGG